MATELDQLASGNWDYIFEKLAPDLALAMENVGGHVSCPVHGGTDGFRLFKDYKKDGACVCNSCGTKVGLSTLVWVNRSDFKTQARNVARLLKYNKMPDESDVIGTPRPSTPTPAVVLDKAANKARIDSLLNSSIPFSADCLAFKYLKSRGLFVKGFYPVPGLLFNSSVRYFAGSLASDLRQRVYFPGMIAPIRTLDGEIGSLHRTYLAEDGMSKADVENPKQLTSKCIDSLSGCAIPLFPADGDALAVAEGIETALAVHEMTGLPVWSCVTAQLLEAVVIPPNVKRLHVFADLDGSGRGQEASDALVRRFAGTGVEVVVHLPPVAFFNPGEKGIDWLDVYSRYRAMTATLQAMKRIAV